MLGTGTPQGNVLEVQFESPWGMVFGVFDSETVERPDGGTGTFVFSDQDNATFSYTPSAFNISDRGHVPVTSLPIIKLFDVGGH